MLEPLKTFVQQVTQAVSTSTDEADVVPVVKQAMGRLIKDDSWLPEAFARCSEASYNQYLLYCDPLERFSVVSFVWGPQQRTPVHDHTVWGVIGQLVGEETSQSYLRDPSGRLVAHGEPELLRAGDIATVSPLEVDVHLVRNPSVDAKAISIHVYGANIGRVSRNTYDPDTGAAKTFISSYSNAVLPNIWM